MKPDIHPNYTDIKVTCSCGNEFTTRVITSYSIHYTKLYDLDGLAGSRVEIRWHRDLRKQDTGNHGHCRAAGSRHTEKSYNFV